MAGTIGHRKGEDVGRLILPPVGAIQLAHRRIGDDPQRSAAGIARRDVFGNGLEEPFEPRGVDHAAARRSRNVEPGFVGTFGLRALVAKRFRHSRSGGS